MAPGDTSIPNVEGTVYVLDTKIIYDASKLLNAPDANYFKDEYELVRAAYNHKYYDQVKKPYFRMDKWNSKGHSFME